MLEAIRGAPTPTNWLVFDAGTVAHVDATGARALTDITADLRRDEIGLVVARMKPHIYDRLADAGLHETIGIDRFHPTVRAAVAACLERDEADSS